MILSKNVNNKKCAPKLVFFNEKKKWERFESQILVLFDTSPSFQFSKFNNFLWVCWFLGKNLSNFVSPAWKLHNPYCHSHHSGILPRTWDLSDLGHWCLITFPRFSYFNHTFNTLLSNPLRFNSPIVHWLIPVSSICMIWVFPIHSTSIKKIRNHP